MQSEKRFWFDASLPFVECRRARHSRACYKPHTHPALSIGAVDDGCSLLRAEGFPDQALQAGDVVLIPPHRVHACNPEIDQPWSYQMLYVDEAWLASLLAEAYGYEPNLGLCYPARLRNSACYQQLCELNLLLCRPGPLQLKEDALIAMLDGLLLQSQLPKYENPPDWLAPLRQLINEQCTREWPLEELAAYAGLSRYHFIRAFRAYTGMTPHAYLLDCRINLARHLLRQGCELAELACQLGFSDQSHFQHAFKARVCATPGEYLRAMCV